MDSAGTAHLLEGIHRTLWLSEGELAACEDRHSSLLVLQCVRDFAARGQPAATPP